MTFKSPAQVKSEILLAFPPGSGELAYELLRSISHLHLKWKNYRALFGTSPERIDLLNKAAPGFFGHMDQIMRHDVVLAITRITDPAGTGARVNASLARLLQLLAGAVEPSVLDSWMTKLSELDAASEPLRAVRNRFLAHEDLATALNYHAQPLPGFSRADIESLLTRIRDLFGAIETRFMGSHTSHDLILDDGGEQLIAALEDADAHKSCVHAQSSNV